MMTKTQFVLAAGHRMNPTKCRSSSGSRMRAITGYIEAASRPFFQLGPMKPWNR